MDPGSLSRVTGCRWRHAACKGSFAARGIRGLTACHRALASGTLRGRSGAFRKLRNKQDQPRKGLGLACGEPGAGIWTNREIEVLREQVGCAALLEQDGWKVDVKESTRRAIKYRCDSRIVIVIHDDRGWFDPLSTAKGDVFSLAEHLGADGFADACDRVSRVVGFVPRAPAWRPAAKSKPIATVGERWRHRSEPRPGSPTWRYLIDERHIPERIIAAAIAEGRLREGPQGSMWAAHSDSGRRHHRLGGAWPELARVRDGRCERAVPPGRFRLLAHLCDRSGGRCDEPCRARRAA